MKRKTMLSSILVVLLLFCFGVDVMADIKPRSAGIGFRGTFWRSNMDRSDIFVSNSVTHTEVDVGGGGGWFAGGNGSEPDYVFGGDCY